jgi:serine/threonine-protein kinase
MPPPTFDLRGELIDNRFRVESRLGEGGTGSVWAVEHVQSLQRFALKTLHDDFASDATVLARFLREARAAGALRTKHVVRIIDARVDYVHDGRPLPFVVMELLEGATLDHVLRARGPVNEAQAVWVASELGVALRMCHENGIVHRDLKPANVFLTTDDEGRPIVKLCDFGIAKLLRIAPFAPDGATHTGAVMGTPMYMAPEQLRAKKDGGPEIDQWAFGLIVFRMLTGFEYFGRASTGAELMVSILSEPMPRPSQLSPLVSPAFDAWFLRSCQRDPSARWPDASAQAEGLTVALDRPSPEPILAHGTASAASGVEARSGGRSTRASPRLPRASARKWTWTIGFATLIMFGAMWQMRSYVDRQAPMVREIDAGIAGEPPSARAAPADPVPAGASETVTSSADVAAATEPFATSPTRGAIGEARARGGAPRPARAPASAIVLPAPAATSARLPAGASCSRSSQCASGLCLAEACQ